MSFVVLPASLHWFYQALQSKSLLVPDEFVFAVPMCFFAITTSFNGPLASADKDIDDDRYDVAAACLAKLSSLRVFF